jgi:hypothetical protein
MLQLREKEIFETLKGIKKYRFVVIGGYAVNAYTLPRFSADCDIVVEDEQEAKEIGKEIEKLGYKKEESRIAAVQYAEFKRYEKEIRTNFRVSVDILINSVLDRHTKSSFKAKWVFENSALRMLKGKTITEELRVRIVTLDALVVMKSISCRNTDIRDVFMLMPQAKNIGWIKEEISKRCDFQSRLEKIIEKVTSIQFKDNLQGVYGYIDKHIFEKHKNAISDLS